MTTPTQRYQSFGKYRSHCVRKEAPISVTTIGLVIFCTIPQAVANQLQTRVSNRSICNPFEQIFSWGACPQIPLEMHTGHLHECTALRLVQCATQRLLLVRQRRANKRCRYFLGWGTF